MASAGFSVKPVVSAIIGSEVSVSTVVDSFSSAVETVAVYVDTVSVVATRPAWLARCLIYFS